MKKLFASLLLSGAAFAGAAQADDMVLPQNMWFVHIGAAGVLFDSALSNVTVGGAASPTAGGSLKNNFTGTLEAGYFLNNNFSLSLAAGFPPTTDLIGSGSLTAAGRLGSVTYGSVILGGQYHFNETGAIRPYVGAGLAYNISLSTTDGYIKNSHVDNGFGAVLQAGVDVPVNDHWSMFVDVKKMFASTRVTGNAFASAGPAVAGDLRLNPWIVSAGIGYQF